VCNKGHRKGTSLDMPDLQARANPSNTPFITRNERVSGSSPLVGLFSSSLGDAGRLTATFFVLQPESGHIGAPVVLWA